MFGVSYFCVPIFVSSYLYVTLKMGKRQKAVVKPLFLIDIPGQETSGRYVIIQMNNGGEPLNLQEVQAFGKAT